MQNLLKNISVIYISPEEINEKSAPTLAIWEETLHIPNTLKLHCIKARTSKQLQVSPTSNSDLFTVVNVFKHAIMSDVSETPITQSSPSFDKKSTDDNDSDNDKSNDNEVKNFEINLTDRVLVSYEDDEFPGEVIAVLDNDFQVNVMHKSGNPFWKWPAQEDNIFYTRKNIARKLDQLEVAGTRGQFLFKSI